MSDTTKTSAQDELRDELKLNILVPLVTKTNSLYKADKLFNEDEIVKDQVSYDEAVERIMALIVAEREKSALQIDVRGNIGTLVKWLEEYHELVIELLKFEHPADREQFYKKAERLFNNETSM